MTIDEIEGLIARYDELVERAAHIVNAKATPDAQLVQAHRARLSIENDTAVLAFPCEDSEDGTVDMRNEEFPADMLLMPDDQRIHVIAKPSADAIVQN
jgi:hypothetical protein